MKLRSSGPWGVRRPAIRRLGAVAGALALLLQLALLLPPIRPAAAEQLPFWLDPQGLCLSDGGDAADPAADLPASSAKPDHHQHCSLCQTFRAGGGALAPDDFIPLDRRAFAVSSGWRTGFADLGPQSRLTRFSSRAPPVLA